MDRRKFFSFLPAVPLSASMAAAALAKEKPPIDMAPDGTASLTLSGVKPSPPAQKVSVPISSPNRSSLNGVSINNLGPALSNNISLAQIPVRKVDMGPVSIKSDDASRIDNETKVSMSVGGDGHLWLKINNEWKRIVTE